MFGAVKITKNYVSKYKYFGYGIGFDGKRAFPHSSGGFGNNTIIFGVDMSSSLHVDNKKKGILILGEGSTQGLDGRALIAEKMYSINLNETRRKFCLSLHYNGANIYLFLNGTEIVKFKAKDSEIGATALSLGNVSKDVSVANMKKKLNWLDLSLTLVLIIRLLQLITYYKFTGI